MLSGEMVPGTWVGNGKCKRSPMDPAYADGQYARKGEVVSMPAEYARRKWLGGRWVPQDAKLQKEWEAEVAAEHQQKAAEAAGFRRDSAKAALRQALKEDPDFASEVKELLGLGGKKGKKADKE